MTNSCKRWTEWKPKRGHNCYCCAPPTSTKQQVERNSHDKKYRRKLESIKAVSATAAADASVAMVASAFFAITRFLENFDEPFHNSRPNTRSTSTSLCWWVIIFW